MVEKMRPRIYSAAQLERQTGLRAAVVVPVLRTRRERRRRWATRATTAAVLCIAIPAGLLAIDRHYMPLQLLAEKVAEKSR